MPTCAAVLDHDAAPTVDLSCAYVADRMPDRGKRGKDIAILQMGQDASQQQISALPSSSPLRPHDGARGTSVIAVESAEPRVILPARRIDT